MPLELPDLNLSEDHLEFRETLRRFLTEHAPMTEVRAVMESDRGISDSLWKLACEELGLAGIAISEAHGGQGFGLKELAIALGESGRTLAPIPLLASAALAGRVVEAVVAATPEEAGRWLEPIAAGRVATLAWVEADGDWNPEACLLEARGDGSGVRLSGEKHFVLDAAHADRFFVVARAPGTQAGEGLGLYAVEANDAGVEVRVRESFDLTRPVSTLRLADARAEVVGTAGDAGDALRRGLDEATALLCAEMVGGMQKVLELAVDYANGRFQFGRAIGSFQAVKHKCADMLIDFEGARTATDAAIVAIDEGDPESAFLTAVAKAHGGPAYVRMTTDNMQIYGGVGYTWEYDAHLYYRRAISSAALLGDASQHAERLVGWVAASLEGDRS